MTLFSLSFSLSPSSFHNPSYHTSLLKNKVKFHSFSFFLLSPSSNQLPLMSGFGWEWFRLFEGGGSWVYRGWPWIHGFDWVFGFGFPVVFWVGFMWLEVVVVRGGLVWIFLVRVLMDSRLAWWKRFVTCQHACRGRKKIKNGLDTQMPTFLHVLLLQEILMVSFLHVWFYDCCSFLLLGFLLLQLVDFIALWV